MKTFTYTEHEEMSNRAPHVHRFQAEDEKGAWKIVSEKKYMEPGELALIIEPLEKRVWRGHHALK